MLFKAKKEERYCIAEDIKGRRISRSNQLLKQLPIDEFLMWLRIVGIFIVLTRLLPLDFIAMRTFFAIQFRVCLFEKAGERKEAFERAKGLGWVTLQTTSCQ